MHPDNNINPENELPNFPASFSKMKGNNPFAVPENYFENLSDRILSEIENSEELKALSPFLSKIEKTNPFKIPENYFFNKQSGENFTERILKNFSQEELNGFLTTLSGTQKKNPFSIPENYFENLVERINQKAGLKQEAKIISLRSDFRKYKYFALANAACIAAIFILYFYYPTSHSRNEKNLFVSADDISNSNYFEEIDESTLIEEINENDMNDNSGENNGIEDYLIDNGIDENTIINEL